jgi:hypothetical protein
MQVFEIYSKMMLNLNQKSDFRKTVKKSLKIKKRKSNIFSFQIRAHQRVANSKNVIFVLKSIEVARKNEINYPAVCGKRTDFIFTINPKKVEKRTLSSCGMI